MRSLNHLFRRSINDENVQRVYRWLFARAHELIRFKPKPKSIFGEFRSLIEQFHRNVPIEYLCGSAMFYHRLFNVNQHVLIPRRDSECLIDEVRRRFQLKTDEFSILEIGTGSGCLAVTLARLYPRSKIIACDISAASLRVAKRNAARHGCRNIKFYCGNLFDKTFLIEKFDFDLIISNPPYISRDEIFQCDRSIFHEPHRALFVDPPLKFYLEILRRAKENWLKRNGFLVFECSPMNVDEIRKIFLQNSKYFDQIEIRHDSNDLSRVISVRKCSESLF